MLKKLAAYRRQNQLDLALQELGRIERTLFMLDWLESPELRRRCHAGLNKSEQRHFLAQVICTFKQGRIADRGAEAQQFRASGLNLVIAAIVYWNSTYIADAVAHLRASESRRPMRCSPTRRRLAGSTSASRAISCGIAPLRPQTSVGRSISAASEPPHDHRVLGPFALSVVYLTTDAMPSIVDTPFVGTPQTVFRRQRWNSIASNTGLKHSHGETSTGLNPSAARHQACRTGLFERS